MLRPIIEDTKIQDEQSPLPAGMMLLDDKTWTGLQNQIWNHTVGVLAFAAGADGIPDIARGASQGSGTLVEVDGVTLIATCAHIFEPLGDQLVVLPLTNETRTALSTDFVDRSGVLTKRRVQTSKADPNDLALIRVERERFTRDGHSFYSLGEEISVVDRPVHVVACGAPSMLRQDVLTARRARVVGPKVVRWGQLKTEPTWSETGERTQDLFRAGMSEFDSGYLDISGEVLKAPESWEGLSGGGLWAFDGPRVLLMGVTVFQDLTGMDAININLWLKFARESM